jgi:hypothetical protein
MGGDRFLVADPVLHRGDAAVRERRSGRRDRGRSVHRLGRDDAEVTGRQCGGVRHRARPADDVARAAQAQPVAVNRVDVVLREVVRPHLEVLERRQIRREERPDRAAAHDADPHEYEVSRAFTSR